MSLSGLNRGPIVEFRTGVRDRLGYAVRWLGVAVNRGCRVRVWAEAADLPQLSQMLWTSEKEGFLPHMLCWPSEGCAPVESVPATSFARSPVWLGTGSIAAQEPELLLNIGVSVPDHVMAYQRVIEVVSTGDADLQVGRSKWATYKKLGLEPAHRAPGSRGSSEPGED